jgi:sulfite reductase beta subunit-like hemoprotein
MPMVERLVAMDHALAEPPKQAEDLLTALPDAASRQDAMEMLVRVCFADGETHAEELRILGDLAVRWGIGADDLDRIRRNVTEPG